MKRASIAFPWRMKRLFFRVLLNPQFKHIALAFNKSIPTLTEFIQKKTKYST